MIKPFSVFLMLFVWLQAGCTSESRQSVLVVNSSNVELSNVEIAFSLIEWSQDDDDDSLGKAVACPSCREVGFIRFCPTCPQILKHNGSFQFSNLAFHVPILMSENGQHSCFDFINICEWPKIAEAIGNGE